MASYNIEDIYPRAFNLYNTIGHTYLQNNQIDEAIDAFHKAISMDPSDIESYCDIASAYAKQNKPDLVRAYKEKAIKIDPNVEFWF